MTFETKLVQAGVYSTGAKALAGGDMAVGLVAAGTTQATAFALTNDISVFGTVAASSGAILPLFGSAYCTVFNGGANALAVYPPVGGTINAAAANAAFSVGAGKSATFMSPDGITWVANLSA
jgi:hypothetical protein